MPVISHPMKDLEGARLLTISWMFADTSCLPKKISKRGFLESVNAWFDFDVLMSSLDIALAPRLWSVNQAPAFTRLAR